MEVKVKNNTNAYAYGALLASFGLFFGLQLTTFGTFFPQFIRNFTLEDGKHKMIQTLLALLFILGGWIAAGTGRFIYDKIGRRESLLLMMIVEIGTLGLMTYKNLYFILFLRVVAGYIAGFWMVLIPTMIREIFQDNISSKLSALFGVFLTGGICISYCFGFEWASERWRWVLAWPLIVEVPKFIVFLFIYKMESPLWLIEHGAVESELSKNFQYIYNKSDADDLATSKLNIYNLNKSMRELTWEETFSKKYKLQIMLGITLNVLNQLTGINYFSVYIKDIFHSMGVKEATSFSIAFGLTGFIASIMVIFMLMIFSNRSLMVFGLYVQIVAHTVMIAGLKFNLKPLVLLGPYVYNIGYAHSLGGIMYDYIGKIIPPKAFPISIGFQWFLASFVVAFTPVIAEKVGNITIFLFFQIIGVIGITLFIAYSFKVDKLSKAEILERFQKKRFIF